jgi:hypothetical protein
LGIELYYHSSTVMCRPSLDSVLRLGHHLRKVVQSLLSHIVHFLAVVKSTMRSNIQDPASKGPQWKPSSWSHA